MILMAGAIFLPVFSKNLPMLFGGEILCGIPWGIFQTLTTAYAADICPVVLRAYLASYVNMCWGIGKCPTTCPADIRSFPRGWHCTRLTPDHWHVGLAHAVRPSMDLARSAVHRGTVCSGE